MSILHVTSCGAAKIPSRSLGAQASHLDSKLRYMTVVVSISAVCLVPQALAVPAAGAAAAAWALVWILMISPLIFSIFSWISLIWPSCRPLRLNPHHLSALGGNGQWNKWSDSHFLAYELQPSVHRAFGLDLVLLEEDRADQLVDGLLVLELVKLLLDAQVLLFLGLELLARGDCRLEFCPRRVSVGVQILFLGMRGYTHRTGAFGSPLIGTAVLLVSLP